MTHSGQYDGIDVGRYNEVMQVLFRYHGIIEYLRECLEVYQKELDSLNEVSYEASVGMELERHAKISFFEERMKSTSHELKLIVSTSEDAEWVTQGLWCFSLYSSFRQVLCCDCDKGRGETCVPTSIPL